MDLPKSIRPEVLAWLHAGQVQPIVIDLREDPDHAADPRLVPGAAKHSLEQIETWGKGLPRNRAVVVYCQKGETVGTAAVEWLRTHGFAACQLEGGFAAWRAAALPLVPAGGLES